MSWWESKLSKVEWINADTSLAYAFFDILTGDPVFAFAMPQPLPGTPDTATGRGICSRRTGCIW